MYLQVLGSVAASLLTLIVTYAWRKIVKFGKRAEKAMVLVEQQLSPNGGNSLKDQMGALTAKMDANTRVTEDTRRRMSELDQIHTDNIARHAENVARLEAIEAKLEAPWDGRERRKGPR